jgi:glycine/D-amino acid oxidase-like deaminating enzyme
VLAQTEFLKGAYLEPRKLTESIFKNSPSKIYFNHDLISIKHESNLATLSFANGKSYEYGAVILAIGSGLQQWIDGLQVSKGHIIGIPKKYVYKIPVPIHHQGYILPPLDDYVWMGSTYEHEYENLEISNKQINKILNAQKIFLKSTEIPNEEILVRASERVSRSNKFPIAGKISQNQCLYAVGALGSRGFSSSFLCGEVVANQIRNGFIPVDYEVLENLEI